MSFYEHPYHKLKYTNEKIKLSNQVRNSLQLNSFSLANKFANVTIPAVVTVCHIGMVVFVHAKDITGTVFNAIPAADTLFLVNYNPFVFPAVCTFHN